MDAYQFSATGVSLFEIVEELFLNQASEVDNAVPDINDVEVLPSNQEACRRLSHLNIDNQHIIRLIQDSVKTALNAFMVRFNERLDAFERRLDAYENNALRRQHEYLDLNGSLIKQVIAAQRLHSETIQQVARDQSLTVELLKQVVLMLEKKLDDDDDDGSAVPLEQCINTETLPCLIQTTEDMNRSKSTTETLLELINIMRSMTDEDPEPNYDF